MLIRTRAIKIAQLGYNITLASRERSARQYPFESANRWREFRFHLTAFAVSSSPADKAFRNGVSMKAGATALTRT